MLLVGLSRLRNDVGGPNQSQIDNVIITGTRKSFLFQTGRLQQGFCRQKVSLSGDFVRWLEEIHSTELPSGYQAGE